MVIAPPTITQKNEPPGAEPFGELQPLQVYSTKPSGQVGMEKGTAPYERDDVQAGRGECPEPKREKGRDDSQPSPLRSFDAGLLRSCPWYAYSDETRLSRLELSLGRGMFPPGQQESPPHSRRGGGSMLQPAC